MLISKSIKKKLCISHGLPNGSEWACLSVQYKVSLKDKNVMMNDESFNELSSGCTFVSLAEGVIMQAVTASVSKINRSHILKKKCFITF